MENNKSTILDETTLEQLKREHGELTRLSAGGESVIVRNPRRVEYERFRKDTFDEKRRDKSVETLLRSVIVWPSKEEFLELLERKPGLSETFGGKVLEMVGATEQADVEKL